MTDWIVPSIIFIATILLVLAGAQVSAVMAKNYKEQFNETASKNLTDLFLFVDSQTLFKLNLLAIVLGFLVVWWLTGNWFPALIVSIILLAAPKKIYQFLRNRRKKAFLHQMPDTLMMLSSSLKAGGSLTSALETMVADSPAPTSQEFSLFLRELRIGRDFGESLDNMANRINEPEVKMVISGMKISKEVGGNLADMLERLADTLRRKLEMEGKIVALTSQGKAQGIVMSLLPAFIVFALNHIEPEAMQRLWTEPAGWIVIAIAVTMQYIGYRFIKKIVTIDV
ncbi:type II secretion system F family protein [Aliikangiella sp. IMCC44653]